MGANEKGVVIGNEAVFTRMPLNRGPALTGMDLLRLALERSDTAQNALETIVRLLDDYGQGGICGYEDKRMAYHNSFIITDPREAWVLETAGELWAAVKVKTASSISNGLTIGEIYDRSHPDLIESARRKGFLKKGKTFHFADCFSDWLYTTFSASRSRRERSRYCIDSRKGKMDAPAAMEILRDHREENYHPGSHLLGSRICAHAANKLTRNATQTTGSLVAHLKGSSHTYWATGTSAPCTGMFKPVWFGGQVLPDLGPIPDGRFNPKTLWWHHERLHRSILLDYGVRIGVIQSQRDALEKTFVQAALDTPREKRMALAESAFERSHRATADWTAQVREIPVQEKGHWIFRRYWGKQNLKAGFALT
jgi:dipeptidase